MSQNIGTLISSSIRPNDSLDLIAAAFANEIKGGSHGYAILSERDAIIIERREWGMFCEVYNDGVNNGTYQLKYNNNSTILSDNLNWIKIVQDDKNFIFTQNVPSTVWNITHTLNKFPSISVIDSAGTLVEGQIEYLSLTQIRLTFNAGFSGSAYLN